MRESVRDDIASALEGVDGVESVSVEDSRESHPEWVVRGDAETGDLVRAAERAIELPESSITTASCGDTVVLSPGRPVVQG